MSQVAIRSIAGDRLRPNEKDCQRQCHSGQEPLAASGPKGASHQRVLIII
jgi:hypothetical protein